MRAQRAIRTSVGAVWKNGYYALNPQEAESVLTKNEKPVETIVCVTLDDGYRDNYGSLFKAIKNRHQGDD